MTKYCKMGSYKLYNCRDLTQINAKLYIRRLIIFDKSCNIRHLYNICSLKWKYYNSWLFMILWFMIIIQNNSWKYNLETRQNQLFASQNNQLGRFPLIFINILFFVNQQYVFNINVLYNYLLNFFLRFEDFCDLSLWRLIIV